MIKSITVTNHLDESIKLELMFPERSGFVVQNIDGLGPAKASINSKEVSTGDGGVFNSSRLTSRNIVLDLVYLMAPTIEASRKRSYRYFPIKRRINFLIETDRGLFETYGYIESNEPNIFSSESGTRISIVCPDPYFYSAGLEGITVTPFSGIEPMFEFPFENDDLNLKMLQMGELQIDTIKTVYYKGDEEIGIKIYVDMLGPVTNLSIFNMVTRESMIIDSSKLVTLTGEGLHFGDTIIISTVRSDKYILLFRDGLYTNILNCLDKYTDWFELSEGDNTLAYTADVGIENLQFRIENQTLHEGV